jgi:Zn-finger nucleic acid-binding protein
MLARVTAALRCPRCELPLEAFALDRATTIDTCARCRGAWFDRGELGQTLGTPRDLGDAPPDELPLAAPDAPTCPRCPGVCMLRVPYVVRGNAPSVDLCPHCEGIWTSLPSLARMREIAALRVNARAPRQGRRAAARAPRRPRARWRPTSPPSSPPRSPPPARGLRARGARGGGRRCAASTSARSSCAACACRSTSSATRRWRGPAGGRPSRSPSASPPRRAGAASGCTRWCSRPAARARSLVCARGCGPRSRRRALRAREPRVHLGPRARAAGHDHRVGRLRGGDGARRAPDGGRAGGRAAWRAWARVRWVLLALGACSFVDASLFWRAAAKDWALIPWDAALADTGDMTILRDRYGWSERAITGRYTALSWLCLAGVLAAWGAALLRRRPRTLPVTSPRRAPHNPPDDPPRPRARRPASPRRAGASPTARATSSRRPTQSATGPRRRRRPRRGLGHAHGPGARHRAAPRAGGVPRARRRDARPGGGALPRGGLPPGGPRRARPLPLARAPPRHARLRGPPARAPARPHHPRHRQRPPLPPRRARGRRRRRGRSAAPSTPPRPPW